jgi:hypothetical protein
MRLGGLAQSSGIRRAIDRYFYFVMSLIVATAVISGFSRTIGDRLFHPSVRPPALLWVHGVAFFGWLGLFVLQSSLVRIRKVKLHKLLGWFFAAFGVAIPVLGIVITRVMSRFEIGTLHYDPNGTGFVPAHPLPGHAGFHGVLRTGRPVAEAA